MIIYLLCFIMVDFLFYVIIFYLIIGELLFYLVYLLMFDGNYYLLIYVKDVVVFLSVYFFGCF